jgi:uncharacterized delta-60 repeat protein
MYNGSSRRGIARVNTNGSLDTLFNPGSVSVDNEILTLALQPDNKVIIGGDFTTFNTISRTHIARLNTNGTLDTTFNPGSGADAPVMAVAVQPNGKILMGGSFGTVNSFSRSRIARLLANGTVDTNFNPGTGVDNAVEALALQTDGKVVLGGLFTNFNGHATTNLARVLLKDPPPVPIVTRITNSTGNLALNWPATKNAVYRADYRPSLTTTNWTPLLPYVTAFGNTAALTNNPGADPQRYYRIAWLPF